MDQRYNLYNLEASFKQYLLAVIKPSRFDTNIQEDGTSKVKEMASVSVKNYLSDLRHFLGWLTLYSTNNQRSNLIASINESSVGEYKSYLIQNNIPEKTVNRRLSTVRKFCSFCISQRWMQENPAKKVTNVILRSPTSRDDEGSHQNDILTQFKSTVDHSVFADVAEFFHIISS